MEHETSKRTCDFFQTKPKRPKKSVCVPVFIMANTRFYLDERKTKAKKPCVLKLAIAHQGATVLVSLDAKVLPNQWDSKKHRVVNHPDQQMMNMYISTVKQQIDTFILSLTSQGVLDTMKPVELKSKVLDVLYPRRVEERNEAEREATSFAARFLKFADSKKTSTRGVYMQTYRRLRAYLGDTLDDLKFEDITKEWLTAFDNFLAQTAKSKNSRNIHHRNVRSVFNEAIDDGITTFYPFRRFKIRPVATAKRNLKVDELRTLFNFQGEEFEQNYLDMFKLMFMLIGINVVDLCNLKEVVGGRINYNRAKTGRLYSIKLEPEAEEIIERHRGKGWLLDILDRYKDYRNFTHRMNNTLKRLGPVKRVGLGGKKIFEPLFPQISTYWARHSWATIAASLDIPKETIAQALGHSTNSVTDIYIEFDQRKVDVANRRVLDWVLYGKK